jgi:hypothetical protein
MGLHNKLVKKDSNNKAVNKKENKNKEEVSWTEEITIGKEKVVNVPKLPPSTFGSLHGIIKEGKFPAILYQFIKDKGESHFYFFADYEKTTGIEIKELEEIKSVCDEALKEAWNGNLDTIFFGDNSNSKFKIRYNNKYYELPIEEISKHYNISPYMNELLQDYLGKVIYEELGRMLLIISIKNAKEAFDQYFKIKDYKYKVEGDWYNEEIYKEGLKLIEEKKERIDLMLSERLIFEENLKRRKEKSKEIPSDINKVKSYNTKKVVTFYASNQVYTIKVMDHGNEGWNTMVKLKFKKEDFIERQSFVRTIINFFVKKV